MWALKPCLFYHGVAQPINSSCGYLVVPWTWEAGEIQKNGIPQSKIDNEGGGVIPRCRRGGGCHGGTCSKSLALVKLVQGPTDSTVECVPGNILRNIFHL
jgi:hypothetical protein